MCASGEFPTKSELRRALRRRRRALGGMAQRLAARRLARALARHPWFLAADSVAGYVAADGEIDPTPLLEWALTLGKQVYLPVLRDGDHLLFGRYRRGQRMRRNRFGIPEPTGERRPPWALALVLLPLVGFDRSGGRLGMGGGFYDRSFAFLLKGKHRSPRLLGLAHHFQQVEQLPREPWDVPLAAVVTDRGWVNVRGR